jgi:hypothetical protein
VLRLALLRLALLRLALLRLLFLVVLNLTRFVLEPPNKLENQPFFSSSAVAVAGVAVTAVTGDAVAGAGALTGASSILSTELLSVASPSPPRCFL